MAHTTSFTRPSGGRRSSGARTLRRSNGRCSCRRDRARRVDGRQSAPIFPTSTRLLSGRLSLALRQVAVGGMSYDAELSVGAAGRSAPTVTPLSHHHVCLNGKSRMKRTEGCEHDRWRTRVDRPARASHYNRLHGGQRRPHPRAQARAELPGHRQEALVHPAAALPPPLYDPPCPLICAAMKVQGCSRAHGAWAQGAWQTGPARRLLQEK